MKNFTLKIKQLFAAMLMLACIPASAQFTATVEQYANNDHSTVVAEFTLTEVAAALQTDTATLAAALDAWYNYDAESGAEKPADMFFLKSGDALVSDYNTTAPGGFWMTSDYQVAPYGEGTVFYEDIWFDQAEDFFGIYLGQYPNALKDGATLTPTFVLKHGDKQVTFDITYIVKPLPTMPEAELEIAKLEIVGETEITVTQYPRTGYDADVVKVSIAGVAESFGLDKEIFATMIPNQMYQAYTDDTYGMKVDSLLAIGYYDGWVGLAFAENGDTLTEACAKSYSSADARFYTNAWSYNEENDTLTCNLGQSPEKLVAGDNFYSYVYIVYGNKAFRIKYNLVIEAAPYVDPNDFVSIGTSTYVVEQVNLTDYSYSEIYIPIDSIAELLGTTATALSFQATGAEGGFTSSSTANAGGYWLTQNGIVCSWNSGVFFVEPGASGDYSVLHVGQHAANQLSVGDAAHTLMYLVNGTQYYTLDITLKIVQREAVKQEFESVATRSYVVQALDENYTWSTKSANIPFADIDNLIGTVEPVLYALNVDSIAEQTGEKYTKNYTMGEKPGFWLNEEGRQAPWGSAPWGITGLNSTSENFVIQCIQMEDMGVVGDVYTGEFYLVNEETGKMITIKLTYQIVDEIVDSEIVGEEWINLPVSMNDNLVEFDFAKVATALGLESVEALFDGYYAKGMKADGTYSDGVDIVNNGLSFNASGAFEEYSAIGLLVTEDYKQFLTYSNNDIEGTFKLEVTMCFEIDSKSYVIHITLLDETSYAEGIESINADNKVGKIYNLQGQEVAAPAKGIYIMNGKKVVIK